MMYTRLTALAITHKPPAFGVIPYDELRGMVGRVVARDNNKGLYLVHTIENPGVITF
jgi:hypothetical protein